MSVFLFKELLGVQGLGEYFWDCRFSLSFKIRLFICGGVLRFNREDEKARISVLDIILYRFLKW